MTPENAKLLLPILTAYSEGQTIQFKNNTTAFDWEDIVEPNFWGSPDCYRIKPKPRVAREFVGKIIETGRDYQEDSCNFEIQIYDSHSELPECGKVIRLREILTEETTNEV